MTNTQAPARVSPPGGSKPLTPKILGFLVAGALLIAVSLWVGDRRGTATASSGPAALVVGQPAADATVAEPLVVEFATTAPLRLTPAGWQADAYHLHALVDGAQRMPAANDITDLGGGRFRWTLGSVGPGPHELRLIWARPDHRSVPEGASEVVSFQVK
ncbi:MAG TPA: hypothetical protein VFQ38_24050 [Longimicrobiales bacterium]|nr:hypothetical protein [Longimicrobiales bacterium]